MAVPKITTTITLTWTDSAGDQIKGQVSSTADQSGSGAIGNEQTIGTSSEAVVLGDVTGAKVLMIKNLDTTNPVYIDTANPATTGAADKLAPGQALLKYTTVDAWYAIATGAPVKVTVICFAQ